MRTRHFPHSGQATSTMLSLSMYTKLQDKDIEAMISVLSDFVEEPVRAIKD